MGQLAIFEATLYYAASTVYVKVAVCRPAPEMAGMSLIFGAVSVTPFALMLGRAFAMPVTLSSAGAVVYLGVLIGVALLGERLGAQRILTPIVIAGATYLVLAAKPGGRRPARTA
ncbi:hypothetical protein [Pontivivens ytuae]|uniref:EamA domain-containing protein n=1 Tax=Pontivivens ytuae TaxID=2789856 RepID=A0A7S9LTX3_9RHOB|nr:hypothetical protein [Pontivivens ytuae]QPH54940.1 hypothetical protein I0K15_04020 [Pontivivens ytuae]